MSAAAAILTFLLAAAEPEQKGAPAAARAPARPPAFLAEPARLGAAELQAETGFQILDWNGDGARDLLQISRGGDRGWLFINRGTDQQPWFEFPERLPCNFSELEKKWIGAMSDCWACDWDGDGDLDILFSQHGWRSPTATGGAGLMVALNTGERRFLNLQDGVDLPNSKEAGTICAADVDGDGRPDAYLQPAKGGLTLFRNTSEAGKPATGPAENVLDTAGKPVVAHNPYPVDFDGDGVIDLASVTPAGVQIHVGVKGGKGTVFRPAVPAADAAGKPIPGGQDLNVLDWDLDGVLDLLVLDESCVARCHRGLKKGAPVFAAKPALIHGNAFARADQLPAVSLHDLDRDGRADLVLGARYDAHCGAWTPWARAFRNVLGESPCAFAAGGFLNDAQGKPLWASNPVACDFDRDGNTDLLYANAVGGKAVSVFLLRGDAQAPRRYQAAPEKLAAVECGNATYPAARAFAVDWNGDGNTDMVIHAWAYLWGRYYLCLNQGTNKEPRFGPPQELEVGGKVLTGSCASACVADWDGDGRPDLLVLSAQPYSRPCLLWLRNADGSAKLAMPPGTPVAFDKVGFLTGVEIICGPDSKPIPMAGSLAAGDLDGDGVTDVLIGQEQEYGFYALADTRLWLLRGVAKGAPAAVRDLAAREETETGVALSWKEPAGAARVEVRCSPWPIDEASWFRAAPAKGPAGAGSAAVGGLERGRVYHFAVCTFGPGGERSAVSNCVPAATRPLRLATLAQGRPAPALGVQSYAGCVEVSVRGGQPPSPPADGNGLRVAQVHPGHPQTSSYDSYLRFDLSPLKGRKILRVVLTVSGSAAVDCDKLIRCREVRADWKPESVRFDTRDGSAKWTPADYGEALPAMDTEPHRGGKQWDATAAVVRLLKGGSPALSLQLGGGAPQMRTGTNVFHDSESKDPALRPRLEVEFEDSGQ